MKRYAILIASPGDKGNLIPGTKVDIQQWRTYLIANHGGAWCESEIESLVSPSINDLEDALCRATECDYVLVAFSGHGHVALYDDSPTTFVHINSREEPVPYFMLRPDAARVFMVLDSCRWDRDGVLKVAQSSVSTESADESAFRYIVRKGYRELYEKMIMKTEKGVITAFGCDWGEEAGDSYSETELGGLYTHSLLSCGSTWYQSTGSDDVLNVLEAHTRALRAVMAKSSSQHPRIHQGRRLGIFPFAVRPVIGATN